MEKWATNGYMEVARIWAGLLYFNGPGQPQAPSISRPGVSPHPPTALTSERLSSLSTLTQHLPQHIPSGSAWLLCPALTLLSHKVLGYSEDSSMGFRVQSSPLAILDLERGKTARREASKCQALAVCAWAQLCSWATGSMAPFGVYLEWDQE